MSEAKKFDDGKPRLELLAFEALTEIAKAMTFGAKKYGDYNWLNGFNWTRLLGSTLRHLFKWAGGEDIDPESGLNHLAHAGANIMMLLQHVIKKIGKDDRPKEVA